MDWTPFQEALGLATSAVGFTEKATSTVQAIKSLVSSDKAPDNGEAAALLNTLATQLTAANMMNVQLSEALNKLSQELRREDAFERERARYELFQTGERDIVLKLKAEEAQGQPIHYICPVCMNSDRTISFIAGEGDFKICQKNREHYYRFKDTPIRQPGRARTDFDPYEY